MGSWFSTEGSYWTVTREDIRIDDPYKGRRIESKELELSITPTSSEKGIPTPATVGVSEEATQIPVTFTDILTSYGSKEVGSTEAFEHVCDTCDNQEHEAVGFCKQCEQFYCFKCCKIHENMKSSRNHTFVAKREFTGIPDERNTLFARQIVPVSVKTIPVEIYPNGQHIYGYNVQSIALSTSTNTSFVLDQKRYSSYFKVINPDGSGKKTNSSTKFHMVVCCSGTNHEHDECFLTSPHDQEIHKGSISTNPFQPVLHFKTSGECWGIAEFDNGFAVSVKVLTGYSLPDWQVQYLDDKGNIKQQIYYDKENKPLFSQPEYLASNLTHDTLYVSDCAKREVIALDVFGKVVFTFSHNDLKNPRALTVDDEDNVYVACGDSVVQIHKSGTKHRVLIQKNTITRSIRHIRGMALIIIDN